VSTGILPLRVYYCGKVAVFNPDMEVGQPARLLSPSVRGTTPNDYLHDQPPPSHVLKRLYAAAIDQPKVYLIFVFRHSDDHGTDHELEHMRDATETALDLQHASIVNVSSISVICGWNLFSARRCFAMGRVASFPHCSTCFSARRELDIGEEKNIPCSL
jgi:hypothetical protein